MSIGPYGLHHCYEVRFTHKMFQAENALQLLGGKHYCCPSHEACDGRMGQEIHQKPQPARRSLLSLRPE